MRIGVDLGGTKIEAVALGDGGRELLRRRVATPRASYDGTVEAIAGLCEGFERELGARGTVGVGTPGAVSLQSGVMKNSNSAVLNGRPLGGDLERRLGRPVRLANDANCFALSEATDGAAAGARVVFGVILGTGCGGGIVLDGRVWTGPNAIAGEWGHNALPWPSSAGGELPGPPCYCGKHGCVETFVSGPGLVRDFRAAGGVADGGDEVAALAAAGDARAEAALERYEGRLARALAGVINLLDPDVIVLGGGMSKLARLYQRVPPLLGSWVFSDRVDTRLLPPLHGDASGVRGAAWLWGEGEGEGEARG
jgi:fructokinase